MTTPSSSSAVAVVVPVIIEAALLQTYCRLTGQTGYENTHLYFPKACQLFLEAMRCADEGVDVQFYGRSLKHQCREGGVHPRPMFFEPSRARFYFMRNDQVTNYDADDMHDYETMFESLGLRTIEDATLTIMTFYLETWARGRVKQADLYAWYPSRRQVRQPMPKRLRCLMPWDTMVEVTDADAWDCNVNRLRPWAELRQLRHTGPQRLMKCT